MAQARYAHCSVYDIRRAMARSLNLALEGQHETAEKFWAQVEQAGRLAEALAKYDQIAARWAAEAQVPRETRARFLARVEAEGRRAEAESVLAELLVTGLSQREAQVELVERFQPLDGTRTRAWSTPDPWSRGRLFRRKADEEKLLTLELEHEDADYSPEAAAWDEAAERLWWARHRRDEANALAAARRRARQLLAAAAVASAPTPAAVAPSAPEAAGSGAA